MITLENATKRYGTTTVVDGVSATIPGGGVTSIIGPNGAGKSTLLSMMSRLLPLDAGTVHVDGLDVSTTPGRVLARTLGILRQENQLTVRLTVRDLVGFGRFPHNGGRPTVLDREHIERALDYLDLSGLADRFVDELSGGQRQRAFIAMVLAQDTDVILLDEPLNNLDMKHSVEMMQLLRRLVDELGKTVVLVIHDINFASCYSDTLMAMRDGAVIHQGPPEEIMTPAVLRDVYDVDIQVELIRGHRIGVYFA
ncbi:ABC transporter ATP-binding protein [Arthrobacter agilis]|uniref:iron ABC transporter ATP-binding protein n=1 Tax=Arthrobacter agilis TaxID=37921 RepID=UPI000B34E348|nr:ABC transporter ATP-binding protein [Arthrobacter agilis]OUM41456.1 iron ABC transporter ATP-binding protein [Arthrobacter agilis]PPB46213.1 iron ABC transporter ATP-binding protein [Arthrobacter agilis]TPV26968.1 ABC transporter ATP-binding protein [Arthrobacter agilis]VDR32898.1 Probable siderophore transport system ATP-binding protein YusV [Arthrobacter agilis]